MARQSLSNRLPVSPTHRALLAWIFLQQQHFQQLGCQRAGEQLTVSTASGISTTEEVTMLDGAWLCDVRLSLRFYISPGPRPFRFRD